MARGDGPLGLHLQPLRPYLALHTRDSAAGLPRVRDLEMGPAPPTKALGVFGEGQARDRAESDVGIALLVRPLSIIRTMPQGNADSGRS